jgi:hypothetical protein
VRRSAVREVADKRIPLLNEYLKVKIILRSFDPLIIILPLSLFLSPSLSHVHAL